MQPGAGAGAAGPVYPMGAAERLTGLSARQIRYYEQKGLIRPARTPAGQRLFSAADIRRLRRIRQLLQQGHNATSIRILLEHLEERRNLHATTHGAR